MFLRLRNPRSVLYLDLAIDKLMRYVSTNKVNFYNYSLELLSAVEMDPIVYLGTAFIYFLIYIEKIY